MKISDKRQILYAETGRKHKCLLMGVTDSSNTDVAGWRPTMMGTTARVYAPKELRAQFPKGKYAIYFVETKDNISWYKLVKKK